jgi:hypothetical protein
VTPEERRALADRALGGRGSTTSLREALAAAGLRLVGPHEDGHGVRRWDVVTAEGRPFGSRWSPVDMVRWIRGQPDGPEVLP